MNRDQRRRLAEARLLAGSLAAEPGPEAALRPLPRRNGRLQATVIEVLAAADHPLRAREIHAAAETATGTTVSWNSLKDCLHKNARRPDSPIERVAHGTYRYRPR